MYSRLVFGEVHLAAERRLRRKRENANNHLAEFQRFKHSRLTLPHRHAALTMHIAAICASRRALENAVDTELLRRSCCC